ncbi:hypothetical protein GH714_001132 [Hevea brasiliensis]|uniref:Uncharacterized protein n=1 Tax=Hevea brasiliensis TaxID=3981 RepID=A0A6A6KGW5_HEVBR|nr:hypothetical protein GH714_001132 [Hevea brasiliensis]
MDNAKTRNLFLICLLFLHEKSFGSMNEIKRRVCGKRCSESGNNTEDEQKKRKLLKRPNRTCFANIGSETPPDMPDEWWDKIRTKGGTDVKRNGELWLALYKIGDASTTPSGSGSKGENGDGANFLLATTFGKVEIKGPGKLATSFKRTKVAAYTLSATTSKALIDLEDGSHPYEK